MTHAARAIPYLRHVSEEHFSNGLTLRDTEMTRQRRIVEISKAVKNMRTCEMQQP